MWYEDGPCGGRETALSGCEAIDVSTVPLGQKAAENCHRDADKHLKAPEKLAPPVSDFVRHPYMLMNLGQRDEPRPRTSGYRPNTRQK
jgi:hypothetical protein